MKIHFKLPTDPKDKPPIKEYNSLYGGQVLGNQLLYSDLYSTQNYQASLMTRAGNTRAGSTVDAQYVIQNSTALTCISLKARMMGQLPAKVMLKGADGKLVDPIYSNSALKYRKIAQKINNLLLCPTNFTNTYDLLTQITLHHEIFGEAFVYLKRLNDDDINSEIVSITCLDPTLVYTNVSSTGYPSYVVSTPSKKDDTTFPYYSIAHIKALPYHGATSLQAGWLASELMCLDTEIDVMANYILKNSPKMSTLIMPKDGATDNAVANAASQTKWTEFITALKEKFAKMESRGFNDSGPVPGGLLPVPVNVDVKRLPLPDIQNADLSGLKDQTTARICAFFGVPVQILGLTDAKFNNVSALTSEVYKSTLNPLIRNIELTLNKQLFRNMPDLSICLDVSEFIVGDEQALVSKAVALLGGGIMTPNEARDLMGLPSLPGEENDKLRTSQPANTDTSINKADTSPQSTGGGGGSDLGVPKINITGTDNENS